MIVVGVGWFGFQVFWGFEASSMPLFLRGFTESKFTISLVTSLAGVTGFFVPPVIGYLSDRTLGRFGRRRPYILGGMFGVLVCAVALPHAGVFGLVALLSGGMYFALRSAETPYLSLLPDVTPPKQRSTASGVMNLCGMIGLICCFVASSLIWERSPTTVFVLVGLACFGAILVTTTFIKEPEALRVTPQTRGPWTYLTDLVNEANALKWCIAQLFWWLGFYMVSSFATLFVAEALGVPEGKSFLVLLVFSIVAALFMLPMGMLGDRFGRKQILSCMVAFWAGSQLVVGLSQNLTHALLTVGLSAIPFTAIMSVGYAFFLDLIPRERTAEFVGISVLSIAIAVILGRLAGGTLIDTLGYRSIFPAAAAAMLVGCVILQFIRSDPAKTTEASFADPANV
jgi:MFS family permease